LIVSVETSDGQDADPPATPVTIHLVRHGETDWNVEGRLQGWTDIPLNATGIEQAHAAASVLAGRPIGSVLSSDLSRARGTAAMIAAAAGLEVFTDPALRERNYGVAEGRLISELDGEAHGAFDARWDDPDFAFPGGESRRDAHLRLATFLAEMLVSPPPQEIVIVSHGGALRLARGFLEGFPVERLPRWNFANAEITTVVTSSQLVTAPAYE
jgi:broad specificity phosphatase PhoE